MDGTFIDLPSTITVPGLLSVFDEAQQSICSTNQKEVDGFIDFVCLESQNDSSLQKGVMCQQTCTEPCITFHSNVFLEQKRILVKCLVDRIYRIYSPNTLNVELTTIKDCLTENGFPNLYCHQQYQSSNRSNQQYSAVSKSIYTITCRFLLAHLLSV